MKFMNFWNISWGKIFLKPFKVPQIKIISLENCQFSIYNWSINYDQKGKK